MQFTTRNSEQIRSGAVTLTFRNWKRPHAKVGGVYRLRPNGAVRVTRLGTARLSELTSEDARCAGFVSVDALATFLDLPLSAEVTKVEFALTDDVPKGTPTLTPAEVAKRLAATDQRSAAAWTARALALIDAHPATQGRGSGTGDGMGYAQVQSQCAQAQGPWANSKPGGGLPAHRFRHTCGEDAPRLTFLCTPYLDG